MIIANLQNSDRYLGIHPMFKKLFVYFKQTDWKTAPLGKIILEEDNLYINHVEIPGAQKDLQPLEFHNRYIDVHIPLSARETIGWADRSNLHEIKSPYQWDSDCGFYAEHPEQYFHVSPGMFAVVFPEDVHAPTIASGCLKKLIAKIKIDIL